MDFGAYVSGRSFESKDLVREKDKKKAAKEEEDKLRYHISICLTEIFFVIRTFVHKPLFPSV